MTSRSDPRTTLAAVAASQFIGWGTTFHLPAVLGPAFERDLGLPYATVFLGLSVMLLVGAAASPACGRVLDRIGARPVLSLGSCVMAAGLALLGSSRGEAGYFLAWTILGLASPMALNLAAWSAIGQAYQRGTTRALAILGFFTGLVSTVAWPVTDLLQTALGWRTTCFVFSALHLAIALPLHLRFVRGVDLAGAAAPDPAGGPAQARDGRPAGPPPPPVDHHQGPMAGNRAPFAWIALALGLNCLLMTGLQVHILAVLKGLGLPSATAIALGAMIGPSQVVSRLAGLGLFADGQSSRIGLLAASAFVVAVAMLVAVADPPVAWLGMTMIVLGAGMGLSLPVRATLPYEVFGRRRYGTWLGRLGLVQNLASAFAPTAIAWGLQHGSPRGTLWAVGVIAVIGVGAMARVHAGLRGTKIG